MTESFPAGQQPLISVVVTCFNLEAYISEAIGSVLSQRGAGQFELVVVDDCSIDSSAEKIKAFAQARYVSTASNSGVMLATLAGAEAAQGDIVCFLDGDDIWDGGKIAAVREAFADPAVALVSHDLSCIDATGRALERPSDTHRVLGPLSASERDPAIREGLLGLDGYIWLGSALSVRKSAVQWDAFAAWVRSLPDPRNVYQDWPLAYWIARIQGARLAYLDRPLFRYRLHGANHSGDVRTVERARRNYRRALLTVEAMEQLARREPPVSDRLLRKVVSRREFDAAKLAAYESRRFDTLRHYRGALPDIAGRRVAIRETAALLALLCLGPRLVSRLRGWASRRAKASE